MTIDSVAWKYIKALFGDKNQYKSIKSTSPAKITNKHHQYLLGDHQVPPTCPNVVEESKKSYIDYSLQKSVEIIFH